MRRADTTLTTALVTGGCSGIGFAMATELARHGYDLVLVSHQEGSLAAAATSLRRAFGRTVHTITVDLARPEAAAELITAVRDLGVRVDILLLNAGIFFFGPVATTDAASANAMMQLHMVTPSLLARHFAGEMAGRRGGHMLFVSSISAWGSFPGIAFYGATKTYLRSFAAALRSELSLSNVNVTLLAPGATATPLFADQPINVVLGRRLGVMGTPEDVARAGLQAMFDGRAEVIPGALSRGFALAAAATPQALIDRLARFAPWLRPGAD
jgi:short-subunit dehydrogenase